MMESVTTENVETPAVPEPPRLSFIKKLWYLFVDPRKTFQCIRGGHTWVILWLLAGSVAISGYYPIADIVKADQMAQVEKQLAQNPALTPEDKQEALDRTVAWFDNPLAMLIVPVSLLFVLLFVSAVLLFAGNILLGGDARFLDMLNAYAWTMMIIIPSTLVTVPLIMAKGSLDVSLGFGVLASEDTGGFIKKVLESFELFGLWKLWLSAMAVSVLAKAPMGKSFATVFSIWLVWVLVQGGLATIGVNFGM